MLLALWSPKGGSGTSVVAAAVALVAAGRGDTRLADLGGDQPAILGLPATVPAPHDGLVGWLAAGPSAPTEWLDDLAVTVVPRLSLLPRGPGTIDEAASEAGAALAIALRDGGRVVLDAGPAPAPAARAAVEVADVALVVVRPCYLALRRAVGDPRLERSCGTILVEGGAGAYAGSRMIAGTIIIRRKAGVLPGYLMRRGTLVLADGCEQMAPTFVDCGVHDLVALRLIMAFVGPYSSRLARVFRDPLRRLIGDMAALGKGETFLAGAR